MNRTRDLKEEIGQVPKVPKHHKKKIRRKSFGYIKISRTFAPLLKRNCGAFSSAGSEHLPYKQRVGGSNPSTPTVRKINRIFIFHTLRFKRGAFSSAGSEHLPYKQRVGGSNPSTPTPKQRYIVIPFHGRLAQLVQSICLTSRGSGVRIPQRPHFRGICPQKIP